MAAPVFIIFGITGDLSKRKLLPALYHLISQQLLPANTKIVGISRRPLDIDKLLSSVELCVLEKDKVCDPAGIQRLRESMESFQLDPNNADDYQRLHDRLQQVDGDEQREHLFYMSIPPDAYSPIVEHLGTSGFADDRTRLLLEKPFGYDTSTAKELIELVHKHFNEDQIYRIDHYLAKETAQNLLSFRMNNPVFSALWNSEHIERVEIKAIEKIGIEGRVEFYEHTGALRDIIQSHLLQLLAITLMDLPASMASADIHRAKQYFLEELLPADVTLAVRAQYDDYKKEVANQDSITETYARIHLHHATERWADVDLVLETGKGLSEKQTSITIFFKTNHRHASNNLRFDIQPNEGINFDLVVKQPGLDNQTQHTALHFDYQKIFDDNQHIDAYERVLMDAVRADQSLFSSDEEVLATWQVLQPLLDAWSQTNEAIMTYPIGADPETITI